MTKRTRCTFTRLRVGAATIALALGASGCVSTDTYSKMEAQKNSEISALQQQKTSLEADIASLKQQTASLEQEKASLLASSQQQQRQYEELVRGLSQEVQNGRLELRQRPHRVEEYLLREIFFDSGRAQLKPGGKEVLKKVAAAVKGYENKIIRVVGHTDNVPVAKALEGTFPTNWELSVARATNVVRFLQEAGVPPERMVASGRGEYDPVAKNDTPEGRQKNRRIEIVLIDENLASGLSPTAK